MLDMSVRCSFLCVSVPIADVSELMNRRFFRALRTVRRSSPAAEGACDWGAVPLRPSVPLCTGPSRPVPHRRSIRPVPRAHLSFSSHTAPRSHPEHAYSDAYAPAAHPTTAHGDHGHATAIGRGGCGCAPERRLRHQHTRARTIARTPRLPQQGTASAANPTDTRRKGTHGHALRC